MVNSRKASSTIHENTRKVGLIPPPYTIHHLLFTGLRFRWRAKISVSDETGTRGVVFLRQPAKPHIAGRFFCGLHCVICPPARRDRNFALQISPVDLDVCSLQTI